MATSIRNTISTINTAIQGVFKGSTLYGVATLVEREGKGQPVVDERPVGFDDAYALQAYHRLGNITVTYPSGSGFGDVTNTVNTFQVSMIVFNNKQITKLNTDEIAMIIQSLLNNINIDASISLTQIILNSQAIFAVEYKGVQYSLNEYQSLMQINYTVEVTFRGNCFDLCPEDFSRCASEVAV